jgi:hypothetical protein
VRAKAMAARIVVRRVIFLRELPVSNLIAQFFAHDLVVFYREDQVVGSTAKMLADGLTVFSDDCYFHV